MNFTFFYLQPDRRVPPFDLIDCEGEIDARSKVAHMFAENRSCDAVEVWNEQGQVFVEKRRPAADSGRASSTSRLASTSS